MDYFTSFSKFLKESLNNVGYKDGVYISLTPTKETNDKIREYQYKHLKDMDINKEIHCTLIYSKKLKDRNKELVDKYGFISDFDEYKSHCTLSYDCKDIDIENLPSFDLYFGNERVEELDDNWTS